MDIGDIAGMSMALSAMKVETAVEVSMLRKAMDMEQQVAAQLIDSLEAVMPTTISSFGHKLDVLV